MHPLWQLLAKSVTVVKFCMKDWKDTSKFSIILSQRAFLIAAPDYPPTILCKESSMHLYFPLKSSENIDFLRTSLTMGYKIEVFPSSLFVFDAITQHTTSNRNPTFQTIFFKFVLLVSSHPSTFRAIFWWKGRASCTSTFSLITSEWPDSIQDFTILIIFWLFSENEKARWPWQAAKASDFDILSFSKAQSFVKWLR